MLAILRSIIQDIDATEKLGDALTLLVNRVCDAIEAEACHVFLLDQEDQEYVRAASAGAKAMSEEDLRIPVGEGMVGLVGERGELLNVEEVDVHPHFLAVSDTNGDGYHTFLGVPIIYRRQLLGVMVALREVAERFDEAEEAFFVTLAVQLAAIIMDTQATRTLDIDAGKQEGVPETVLSGIPSSQGVAVGTAAVVYPLADLDAVPDRDADDIQVEMVRYEESVANARTEIVRLGDNLTEELRSDGRALFDAYLQILESTQFNDDVLKKIRAGSWAQGALKQVIKHQVLQFESLNDPYLQERATDVRNLGRRILFHLQSGKQRAIVYPEKTILVGEDVTPASLIEVPEGQLAGVVSVKGSVNSHVAILARALGVPTVMGVVGVPVDRMDGKDMIIDGYYGQVYIAPPAHVRAEFLKLAEQEEALDKELEDLRELPAETPDGHIMSLYVNTGLEIDIRRALSVSAEGVGLFRTEVPFMMRERFPSEDEQRIIYRQLLKSFDPRPVMIRTLDIGGDKPLSYFPVDEDNPFLGWRGIRLTLDHPEIFLTQLRALLRAGIGLPNLHIMLPMVSTLSEVTEARRLMEQALGELREEGHDVQMPALGVVVEVPSVVYQIDDFVQHVDFISVGSNDLIQYLLAVDRNNARVAGLYDSFHPAVLRALMLVVDGAHAQGKRVSICGEMGGDPAAVILLLAMGFDAISMSAARLPKMKWVMRSITMARAQALLAEALTMDDAVDIRCMLETEIEDLGLVGLIRAGR